MIKINDQGQSSHMRASQRHHESLAAKIVRALGGDVNGNGGLIPGPGHSRSDRSVSVSDHPNDPDDVIIHSFAGDDWQVIKGDLRALGLLKAGPIKSKPASNSNTAVLNAAGTGLTIRQKLKRQWAQQLLGLCRPAARTIAEKYLREARGINRSVPACLRFHPSCPRGKGNERLPALVAPVVLPVCGTFCGIQRTCLRDDGVGNALVPKSDQKRSLGPTGGGAIVIGDLATWLTLYLGQPWSELIPLQGASMSSLKSAIQQL